MDRAIAWRGGRRYPEYLARYRAMRGWSRERLLEWQQGKLRRLLAHAYEAVPYWRSTFDAIGAHPEDVRSLEDLRRLPLLDKDTIRAQSTAMMSRAGGRGRVNDKSTGGSTGRNIYFKLDRETNDWRRAAGRLTEEWDDVVPGTRLATLWGSSLEGKASRGARLYDRLSNRLFLSAYGVGDAELDRYLARLERFRPEVLSSYPSILRHVARRMGRERCRKLGVRLIYCSSEALYEPVREELQETFAAVVRNRYASREFGMIASDAPDGAGLFLMDMRLIVEPLDPAANGPTELVVTDLDNHVWPFIRYRIEDLGVFEREPPSSPWPFARLRSLEGRSLDVIVTPEGRAFGGTFFTIVFRPFDETIAQFQVVQDRVDHLSVKLVPGPGFDGEARAKVEGALAENLGPRIAVDIEIVSEIAPLPSGKRRFVVSELEPREGGVGTR
jgi:phenylacetate-CoA ligase